MSSEINPEVEAPSQEREQLVRPNRIQVNIVSTLSSHKGSEMVVVHPQQKVGDLLLAYLQGKEFPHGYMYCLRDEDGLLLWNSSYIGNLSDGTDPLTLYVCMGPEQGVKNIPRMLLYVIATWAAMLFTFIFFLNLFAPSILSGSTSTPSPLHAASVSNRYELVVDAGSVHTDISLYEWGAKINNTGVVHEIFSCETAAGQGVSSFFQKPEAVQDYLLNSQCLKDAIERVPATQRDTTDIFLGTTAGMRILNATNPLAAQQIIGNISVALNKTNLHYTNPNAVILSGEKEGVMGWITSNYLSHKFGASPNSTKSEPDQEPMGALDWGGASAQITFIPRDSSQGNHVVTLFNKQYNVFTKSNLCYGQAEGLKRYLVGLIYKQYQFNGQIVSTLNSPCHPKGKKVYKTSAKSLLESPCARYKDSGFQKLLNSTSQNTTFSFIGQSDPSQCTHEILPQFNLNHCRSTYEQGHCLDSSSIPRPRNDAKFLAFSTYWYLLRALQENRTKMGEAHFEGMSEKLCASSYHSTSFMSKYGPDYRQNSCFKSVFMDLLLSAGYKKDDWVNISFVKRVSDAEVGWSLGYMLQKTNQLSDKVLYVMEERTIFLIILFALSFYTAIIYILWYICTYTGNDKMIQR